MLLNYVFSLIFIDFHSYCKLYWCSWCTMLMINDNICVFSKIIYDLLYILHYWCIWNDNKMCCIDLVIDLVLDLLLWLWLWLYAVWGENGEYIVCNDFVYIWCRLWCVEFNGTVFVFNFWLVWIFEFKVVVARVDRVRAVGSFSFDLKTFFS
jgi:hypothetical protein